ncbi:unnamed protein product [Mytilus coruscus]|uniref:Uncharacterized protein n=1 Tax=Mytilus coruscus TaxID=42192 RepID=A0A6J8BQJ3_MYTCO|nr:unnamed protein product [Mytilus coruscus]
MKGLDNYAAEGAKGVDDLKKIVNVLGKQLKGKELEDGILQRLSKCEQYLKLDYKVHISLETEVPDHCCQFALSFDSREYSVACAHSHDAACSNCNDLYQVIEGIKQAAGEVEFENEEQKDDIQYFLSQWSIKIIVTLSETYTESAREKVKTPNYKVDRIFTPKRSQEPHFSRRMNGMMIGID